MSSSRGLPGISVVIPCFGSKDSLARLAQEVHRHLSIQSEYEIIYVDDGSPPETWATIQGLAAASANVKGLRLSKNYGQHAALLAGVRAASFPITVTLDDDLQNPPSEIPALVGMLLDNKLDVVYGIPEKPSHSGSRRLASKMNHLLLSTVFSISEASELSSFRAFRTDLRLAFEGDLGTDLSLDALLSWASSAYGSLTVTHAPRQNGKSGYSTTKLLGHALDIVTGYSTLPLRLSSALGMLLTLGGFALFLYVIAHLILSRDVPAGFTFLAAAITLFAGAQFLLLGVIGEYLARVHFRVMKKPSYVVKASTEPFSTGDRGASFGEAPSGQA